MNPFVRLIRSQMEKKKIGLRHLCRQIPLDPSFFSKVLSGKRSPPGEEKILRRLAELLGIDPLKLIVSAGRIPEGWQNLFLELAENPRASMEPRPTVETRERSEGIVQRPITPSATLSEELL